MKFDKNALLSTALLLGMWAPSLIAGGQDAATIWQLGTVEFTGLERYTHEEILDVSGLEIGQSIDVSGMNQAVQTLIDTGLFIDLVYSYRYSGGRAQITFDAAEESPWDIPVLFDNFIWFTDEELLQTVSENVPSFRGLAPNSTVIVDTMARALEELLRDRAIEGRVSYQSAYSRSTSEATHVFAVTETASTYQVCELHFPGSTGVNDNQLAEASQRLIDSEYSRKFASDFAIANLIPIYRQQGHLTANFEAATATVASTPSVGASACVTVAVPVLEGPVFSWERSEWTGNDRFSSSDLTRSLGMTTGELANGLKIDEGLSAVNQEYRNQGYLAVRLNAMPVFHDTNRVSYSIDVTEGPQYRMGELTVTGLSDDDINRLKDEWKLATGAAYDESYLRDYQRDVLARLLSVAIRNRTVDVMMDRARLTVDVSIAFED
jgi:outer membrane protein assembly factor BamA